ncbi:hypothetical protein Tco_0875331 [Tanacetum coccineum]|uniref:Uncharacterized protein n=1 Tax=Tanacetum coccineum TaxID=301880 RepID=A0ABQ5BPA9_9ASTR
MACDDSDGASREHVCRHGGLKSLLKTEVGPVRAFIAFKVVILPFNIKAMMNLKGYQKRQDYPQLGWQTFAFAARAVWVRPLFCLNEPPLLEGHTSGSGEGRMEHTFELMDNVPPTPYDSPLLGGYTPASDEGRLKLEELMAMYTKLSKQVLDLEKEKDAQAMEILKLKKRVKKLERKRKSSISHTRQRIYRQVKSSDDDDLDEKDASK